MVDTLSNVSCALDKCVMRWWGGDDAIASGMLNWPVRVSTC